MNVVAKISCYLEHSVVTLKLREEYLKTVTYNTSILLWIKYWTVRYIEHYSMSTYTNLRTVKNSPIFWPTLYKLLKCYLSVYVSVWMLTMVAQIVTVAHRDL